MEDSGRRRSMKYNGVEKAGRHGASNLHSSDVRENAIFLLARFMRWPESGRQCMRSAGIRSLRNTVTRAPGRPSSQITDFSRINKHFGRDNLSLRLFIACYTGARLTAVTSNCYAIPPPCSREPQKVVSQRGDDRRCRS